MTRVLVLLCALLALAAATPHPVSKPQPIDESPICLACELVVYLAEAYVNYSHLTVDEIVDELNKICELLPSEQDLCKGIVASYGKKIATDLVAGKDPEKICAEDLHLCDETGHPFIKEMALRLAKHEKTNIRLSAISTRTNDVFCDICKLAVALVEQWISDEKTEKEIEEALEEVCEYLGDLNETCYAFVEQYLPQLIELLVNMFPPEQACAELGLCDSRVRAPVKKPVRHENDLTCTGCKFIIKEVEKYLSENTTEQEIIDALEKVCDLLPGSLADECDMLVETFLPDIIDLLLDKQPPEVVCKEIGLCKKLRKLFDSLECAACKFLVEKVEEFIESNSTEQEILKLVDEACALLPGGLADACTTFAADNLIALIEAFLAKETPDVVCHQLSVCKDLDERLRRLRQGLMCPVCEEVVSLAKDFLDDDAREEQITHVIEGVCDVFPGEAKDLCQDFIETYGPEVIKSFVEHIDPEKICTFLGICHENVSRKPRILTTGP